MKKIILLTIAIPMLVFAASTGWARALGGVAVQQTFGGGYILVSNAGWDYWLGKLNPRGDTVWTKRYGSPEESDRCGWGCQTLDGGYILTGHAATVGPVDIWLVKTDAEGDTIWTRAYGKNRFDWGNHVEQTEDGGYIVTGYIDLGAPTKRFEVWGLRTDENGDTLWTIIYGADGYDRGTCAHQTTDGGFIITGYVASQLILIKVKPEGDIEWTKSYGEEETGEAGLFVRETSDGGFIVVGYKSTGYEDSLWLLKTDERGDTLWTRTYGEGSRSSGSCVRQTPDGGYIITGSPWTLMKTDEWGDTLWTRTYLSGGNCVNLTDDGGYIVSGNWLYKTDANGNIGDVGVTEVDSLEDINYGETYSVKATVENFGRTTEAFPARCVITFRDLEAPEIRVDTVYWDTIFVDSLAASQTRVVSFKDYDFPQKGLYWMYATTMLDGDADPYNDYASSYMGEGIEEQPHFTPHPTFEVITAVGPYIVLRFSPSENGSQGGCVAVFDAAGRLVDEIRVPAQGGTVTWPEAPIKFSPGVYFFTEAEGSQTQKAILIK